MTDMKKSRFTEGQIIGFLKQADAVETAFPRMYEWNP